MRALLAVDLRKGSDVVIGCAREWATRLGATIDLAYIDEFRSAMPGFAHENELEDAVRVEWRRMEEEDTAALLRLLELLPPENRGAPVLGSGAPAEGLVALAGPYEVILVATHGRTGMAHFWLGSVAEKIVRLSPKPVLVLRLPAEAA